MVLFIGGGIIFLYLSIVIACTLCALVWAGRRKFSVWGKSAAVLAVLLIAYAIPFGDHTIGLIKFKKLCDEQAGERIFQTVNGVEGIVWGSGQRSKPYTTYGYSFHETQGKGSEVFRYVRRKDGNVIEENGSSPNAKFLVRRNENVQIGTYLKGSDFLILELSTERTLASHSTVHYTGGWLIRDLQGIGVGGYVCPTEPFNSLDFIHSVLRPIERTE